jgi:uncharacterized protein (TIGR03437 family)
MKTTLLAFLFASSLSSQSYYVTTVAGGIPTSVPATSVSIGVPGSVAVDRAGNLYFPSGATVVEVNAQTHILTVVAGNGIPGFSGDGGPATAAQLYAPNAVAVDSAGNLYIADSYRIREVSSGTITTIAGNGTAGTTGDNSPATSAEINPLSLAADSAGNLFIANKISNTFLFATPGGSIFTESDSIREISHGLITTVAGSGACCHVMTDGLPAPATPLYALGQIAVDADGNLYAAASAYPNSDGVNTTGAILKIANGVVTTVTAPSLSTITGVAVDSVGNIYYCDPGDVNGNGVYQFSFGKTTTLYNSLGHSQALTVDTAGNLYIADSQGAVIRQFVNGSAPAVAGNGNISFSGDKGPATSAQFDFPGGLALDSSGNLYLADQDNSRIRQVAGGVINTVAGSSAQGFSGDGGTATAAGLYNATDVALDSAGNLYIADSVDECVRMVSKGIITTIAGRGSGATGFGDGGPATAAFFASVNSVAVDSAGNVYVSDGVANRVRKISNGIITTVAGNGTRGFSGDGGPATAAELFGPRTVRVDAAGNLYIVDSDNYRIRKVSNGIITTIAGNGSQASAGDGGLAVDAGMRPGGIALDGSGNLFLSDWGAIREISGGVIRTIAGTGTEGYSADYLPALSAAIFPSALLVDSAGDIYFSEQGSGRVRVLKSTVVPPPTISKVVSAASFEAPIEAGSWVMIQGSGLANNTHVWQSSDFTGTNLPTSLDGTSVTIDGVPAYVEYISSTQVNVLAPADSNTGSVNVVVTNNGNASTPVTAQLQSVAPAFFMSPSYNVLASVIPGYTPVTAATPAMPGNLVVLWATGFGPTNPPTPAGAIVSGAPSTATIPVVTVGGTQVPVVSSVLTTGTVGLYQITIQLPPNVPTGTPAVQASIGGAQTQSGTTLFVGRQ